MGHLRVSEDHLGTGLEGGPGGRFWGHIEVNSRPYSRKPHEILRFSFIWPWVGPYL